MTIDLFSKSALKKTHDAKSTFLALKNILSFESWREEKVNLVSPAAVYMS